jgi:hypothetical protein
LVVAQVGNLGGTFFLFLKWQKWFLNSVGDVSELGEF